MKLFWKINIYLSIITFMICLFYLATIIIPLNPPIAILSITSMFFLYGTFLEIVQIPICLIALISDYRPKRLWLFFLVMIIFLTVKITLYVYILGSI
ncbi:hypothetical protein [Pedobacter jeongneungensis]|uniref:hypothetical protein n=1 Tax=Pedobacter jeongneungensis TaxID=947309 RepID=UPI000469DFBD|nr:hypothetical protein [Pedobacter jeongneungensis]